jgi:hypothetical protein
MSYPSANAAGGRLFMRSVAAVMAACVFLTQSLFASVPERSFWSQRGQAARRLKTGADGLPGPSMALDPELLQEARGARAMLSRGLKPFAAAPAVEGTDEKEFPLLAEIASLLSKDGTLRSFHRPRGAGSQTPIVILLQDVHGRKDAQTRLMDMLQALAELRPGLIVGVEGASGPVDAVPFRGPSARVNAEIASFLLNAGLIAGPEAAAVTAPTPLRLVGIEEPSLYLSNVDAVRRSGAARESTSAVLASLRDRWRELEPVRRAPALRDFLERVASKKKGETSLSEHVFYLADAVRANTSDFPQVSLFRQAGGLEKKLDIDGVEEERSRLLLVLSARLSSQALRDVLDGALLFRAGRVTPGAYYGRLWETASGAGIRPGAFPRFELYVRYLKLVDELKPELLSREVDFLEARAGLSLCDDDGQREAFRLARDMALAEKLVSLSLTTSDWADYTSRRGEVRRIPGRISGLDAGPSPTVNWASSLDPFEGFYAAAEARNETLARRLLEAARESSFSVLVAGGFHTEGLARYITEGGHALLVVAPKIDGSKEQDEDVFSQHLRNRTPLETLFESPKVTLSNSLAVKPLTEEGRRRNEAALPVVRSLQRLIPRLASFQGEPSPQENVSSSRMVSGNGEWAAEAVHPRDPRQKPYGIAIVEGDDIPPSVRGELGAPILSLSTRGGLTGMVLERIPGFRRRLAASARALVERSARFLRGGIAFFLKNRRTVVTGTLFLLFVGFVFPHPAMAFTFARAGASLMAVPERGDTLSELARMTSTSIEDLQRVNPEIVNPDKIYVGEGISLPFSALSPASPDRPSPATGQREFQADRFSPGVSEGGTSSVDVGVAPFPPASDTVSSLPEISSHLTGIFPDAAVYSLFITGALMMLFLFRWASHKQKTPAVTSASEKGVGFFSRMILRGSTVGISWASFPAISGAFIPAAWISFPALLTISPSGWVGKSSWLTLLLSLGTLGVSILVDKLLSRKRRTSTGAGAPAWRALLEKRDVDSGEKLSHLMACAWDLRGGKHRLSQESLNSPDGHRTPHGDMAVLALRSAAWCEEPRAKNESKAAYAKRKKAAEFFKLFAEAALKTRRAYTKASDVRHFRFGYGWTEKSPQEYIWKILRRILGMEKELGLLRLELPRRIQESVAAWNAVDALYGGGDPAESSRSAEEWANFVFKSVEGPREQGGFMAANMKRKLVARIFSFVVAGMGLPFLVVPLLGGHWGVALTTAIFNMLLFSLYQRYYNHEGRRDPAYEEALKRLEDAKASSSGSGIEMASSAALVRRDLLKSEWSKPKEAILSEMKSKIPSADVIILVPRDEQQEMFFKEKAKDRSLFREDVPVFVLPPSKGFESGVAELESSLTLETDEFLSLAEKFSRLRGRPLSSLRVAKMFVGAGGLTSLKSPPQRMHEDLAGFPDSFRDLFELQVGNLYRATRQAQAHREAVEAFVYGDRLWLGPVHRAKQPGVSLMTAWASLEEVQAGDLGVVAADEDGFVGRIAGKFEGRKIRRLAEYGDHRDYDPSNAKSRQFRVFSGMGVSRLSGKEAAAGRNALFRDLLAHVRLYGEAGAQAFHLHSHLLVPMAILSRARRGGDLKEVEEQLTDYFGKQDIRAEGNLDHFYKGLLKIYLRHASQALPLWAPVSSPLDTLHVKRSSPRGTLSISVRPARGGGTVVSRRLRPRPPVRREGRSFIALTATGLSILKGMLLAGVVLMSTRVVRALGPDILPLTPSPLFSSSLGDVFLLLVLLGGGLISLALRSVRSVLRGVPSRVRRLGAAPLSDVDAWRFWRGQTGKSGASRSAFYFAALLALSGPASGNLLKELDPVQAKYAVTRLETERSSSNDAVSRLREESFLLEAASRFAANDPEGGVFFLSAAGWSRSRALSLAGQVSSPALSSPSARRRLSRFWKTGAGAVPEFSGASLPALDAGILGDGLNAFSISSLLDPTAGKSAQGVVREHLAERIRLFVENPAGIKDVLVMSGPGLSEKQALRKLRGFFKGIPGAEAYLSSRPLYSSEKGLRPDAVQAWVASVSPAWKGLSLRLFATDPKEVVFNPRRPGEGWQLFVMQSGLKVVPVLKELERAMSAALAVLKNA